MIIINAKIYTMADKTYSNGYIKIKNGKITEIGNMSDYVADERCSDIFDAAGNALYPGFIDSHTHIGICEDSLGFEGDDCNEMTNPLTPQLRAIDAINPLDACFKEALEAGITSVITGPGSSNPIAGQVAAVKTYGVCVDDMLIKTPVAIKMALGENPKSVYHERKETPITRMATAAIIRNQLYEAKEYLKKKKAEEEFDYDDACEALIPLLEGKIPAHIHAHRADDIMTAVRIAKEFSFDFIIVHGTRGHLITSRLVDEKVRIMSGPLICERSKPELRDLTPKAPGLLNNAGVKLTIVTDHPVVPIQYLAISAGLAVREGLDRTQAMKAITINAAEFCGIEDRVGSIEVGKDADIIVFDMEPLSLEAKPLAVIVDGVLRYKR